MIQEERPSLIIVDSDLQWAKRLGRLLDQEGFAVEYAAEVDEAEAKLKGGDADFIVLDLNDTASIQRDQLRDLTDGAPHVQFVGLIASGRGEDEEAMFRGAGLYDLLPHDMPIDRMARALGRLGSIRRLEAENEVLRHVVECRTAFESLLGGSAPMRALYRLIGQVSKTDAPVLITGEPGSEFGSVARSVHQHSERSIHPLVMIECDRSAPREVELAIFGRVGSGSHPNGPSAENSAFARAGNGTLVLSHVEHLGEAVQSRLLSFFHAPFFQGESSSSPQPIARIVVTSTVDLRGRMEKGGFSRELFYRLSVLQVRIPPLRERREDIPMLAEFELHRIASTNRKRKERTAPSLSTDALLQLFQYDWPGNVDELSATIQQGADRSKGSEIRKRHLPPSLLDGQEEAETPKSHVHGDIPLREAKRSFESEYFKNLLRHTGGNMTLASRISKVGRPYLYKKIKDHSIEPNDYR